MTRSTARTTSTGTGKSRWIGLGAVLAVLLVIAGLVAVKLTQGSDSTPAKAVDSGVASTQVVQKITGIPASVFDKVGIGAAASGPIKVTDTTTVPGTTKNGLPRVVYVGAEYCPFCAAQRWSVVAALSRFGTFTNLGQTASSPEDVYPSTSTLTFHGSTYTSKYLAFDGYEVASNKVENGTYAPLDVLSDADNTLVSTFNAPPYMKADQAGGIPFMIVGGRYLMAGSTYSPEVLKGLTHAQIADALDDPNSKVAQAIDGSANVITATLCDLTGQQPAAVCSSKGVQAAAKAIA